VDSLLLPLVLDSVLSGSVLIAHEGRIVFAKGYGAADRERGIPNTPGTIFRIGSITKPFTAISIMQLREAGRLELDAPLSRYLPDFPNGGSITIRHLLNHTSGIPDYNWTRANNRPQELGTVVDWIRQLRPTSAPGERFEYSNSGYALLARIIERVSGKDYIEFVRENTLARRGMENTGLYSMDDPPARMASGHTRVDYGGFSRADRPSPLARGDGDLYSTVFDLLRFGRALIEGDLISRESWGQVLTSGMGPYGLGWFIGDSHGERVVYHQGGTLGFIGNLQVFPEHGTIVVNLFNTDFLLSSLVERELAAIALGKPWRRILQDGEVPNDAPIARFVGEYGLDSSSTFTLTLEGGHLYFQESGKARCMAHPFSDNEVYVKELNARIAFEEPGSGEVRYSALFGLFLVTGRRVRGG